MNSYTVDYSAADVGQCDRSSALSHAGAAAGIAEAAKACKDGPSTSLSLSEQAEIFLYQELSLLRKQQVAQQGTAVSAAHRSGTTVSISPNSTPVQCYCPDASASSPSPRGFNTLLLMPSSRSVTSRPNRQQLHSRLPLQATNKTFHLGLIRHHHPSPKQTQWISVIETRISRDSSPELDPPSSTISKALAIESQSTIEITESNVFQYADESSVPMVEDAASTSGDPIEGPLDQNVHNNVPFIDLEQEFRRLRQRRKRSTREAKNRKVWFQAQCTPRPLSPLSQFDSSASATSLVRQHTVELLQGELLYPPSPALVAALASDDATHDAATTTEYDMEVDEGRTPPEITFGVVTEEPHERSGNDSDLPGHKADLQLARSTITAPMADTHIQEEARGPADGVADRPPLDTPGTNLHQSIAAAEMQSRKTDSAPTIFLGEHVVSPYPDDSNSISSTVSSASSVGSIALPDSTSATDYSSGSDSGLDKVDEINFAAASSSGTAPSSPRQTLLDRMSDRIALTEATFTNDYTSGPGGEVPSRPASGLGVETWPDQMANALQARFSLPSPKSPGLDQPSFFPFGSPMPPLKDRLSAAKSFNSRKGFTRKWRSRKRQQYPA
ncbi:hypothetical protein BC835DRAFT_1410554 [Cytidiella melzeri]|nr:hypothetical protein BC835DRAFT_1410554 [Cytidiella melzeri]